MLFSIGLSFFVFKEPKPVALGLTFGGLMSMATFLHLYRSIKRSLDRGGKAQAYAISQYIIRYLLYGATLVVAAKADYLNLWATTVGLFMVKIVIYAKNIVDYTRS